MTYSVQPATAGSLSPRHAGRLVLAVLTAALLAGCSSLGKYEAPSMAVPTTFAASGGGKSVDNSQTTWWLAFRDKQLNALIERGLAENLSIAQAVERINEANAGAMGASASFLPSVSGTSSARVEQKGDADATSSVTHGGSASWVLDLFGQGGSARAAAQAKLDAAYYSVDAARLTFLSEVTNAYIDLRYAQESLALTRSGLATRQQTLKLTQTLLDSGAGSQLDVLQAQGALDAASLQLPGLELSFIAGVNRLATLTAQFPQAIEKDLQKGAPQPWPRVKVNAGIPADLIRQRPDIKGAERAVMAAAANARITEAAMYPSLTLSGSIGLVQASGGNVGSWGFGPTLNLPFLDGGKSKAGHTAALSQLEQAYLSWQQTVRAAIEETENALAAVRRDGRTIDGANKVKQTATQQLELARYRYESGEGQILDVLNAERSLFDAQGQVASAAQRYASNYVRLNVAIGGGISALSAAK